MNKAIFLDRDGIINKSIIVDDKPYPPKDLKEFELVDDIFDLLFYFKELGYMLFVITNQPDVSRGKNIRFNVLEIHLYLSSILYIDDIKTCFHDGDWCDCRKPKPGMILELAALYNIDLCSSMMVGDRRSDILAGNAAGCYTVFVDYDYDEPKATMANAVVQNISEIKELL